MEQSTPEDESVSLAISVLEESFDLLAPRSQELVDRTHERAFAAAPAILPHFAATDARRQRQTVLATLVLLRTAPRDLDGIIAALRALGARPEDYMLVGPALLDAMAEIGGSAWRPEYARAWADAYQVLRDAVLSGANGSSSRETDVALAASGASG
jgi:hemoglobin-like flavoprotein